MAPPSDCPVMPTPEARAARLNTNTYVSVGILITILTGFFVVINTIYTTKTELVLNQYRSGVKLDNLTERMDKYEKAKETWSFQDMFKWAVHLQQSNQGKIVVPEPTTSTP